MTTPIIGAPELVSAQAVPETTVNEIARYLEQGALWFGKIKDRDLATPPGSPADGDAYIVAGSPTGAWAGQAGKIAFYVSTAWDFITPTEGMAIYVADENAPFVYDGAAFVGLGGAASGGTFEQTIACSDETTALTTGTAKVTFRMPAAVTLTAVRASVTTAPTGSVLTVDINEGGASILSTKLTIDVSEKTSATAATPAVISDTALADDAEITIDIDTVGSTIAGAGLKVTLIGTRT